MARGIVVKCQKMVKNGSKMGVKNRAVSRQIHGQGGFLRPNKGYFLWGMARGIVGKRGVSKGGSKKVEKNGKNGPKMPKNAIFIDFSIFIDFYRFLTLFLSRKLGDFTFF
jgi:hypothetical protein